MKIVVDRDRCVGHARCATLAPDVYPLDDDGCIAVDTIEPASHLNDRARRGARACPERVITIIEVPKE